MKKGPERIFSDPFFKLRLAVFNSLSAPPDIPDGCCFYMRNFYAFGGVPSAFDTTASIWIKASIGNADTPIVLLAGTPPGKYVL